MKILKLISVLSIAILVLLVSILSFLGTIEVASMKMLMLIGTIIWFATTPFWLKEEK